jgi:hypothetical protein
MLSSRIATVPHTRGTVNDTYVSLGFVSLGELHHLLTTVNAKLCVIKHCNCTS